MSEDKTQNGYEGSQELDFQDAKEMTVGEAVRKEAEINAGVTETDSILDKYIKQHREEVASQKFSKQKVCSIWVVLDTQLLSTLKMKSSNSNMVFA